MRLDRMRGLGRAADGAAGWTYSGAHSVREVDTPGGARTLVTITGSGALSVGGGLVADVWMCGCGAAGGDGVPGVKGGDGGGGAYCARRGLMPLVSGPVTIARTPAGRTMYADLAAAGGSGKNGGSGGGAGAMVGGGQVAGGAGDGAGDTVPFGLGGVFQPHCAGGGGGGFDGGGSGDGQGGAGGTGGASGGGPGYAAGSAGGAGGVYGGGPGGPGTGYMHGQNALQTQPGAGGGGGGAGLNSAGAGYGGTGSPGVMYLLL